VVACIVCFVLALASTIALVDLADHPSTSSAPRNALPNGLPNPSPSSTPEETASRASLEVGVVDVISVLGQQQAEAAGTGIVVGANGLVVTNNHVIDGATTIHVTVVSTAKTYSATVVGTDPTADIAVLQLSKASGLTTVRVGQSSTVKIGAQVVAIGNAGGRGTLTMASGTVTELHQTVTASDESAGTPETLHNLVGVAANLQPGDSGGPLYDSSGRVIGIDTIGDIVGRPTRAGSTASSGYAIPIDDAMSAAGQIESGHPSATVTIGTPLVIGIEVDPRVATTSGVRVDQVVPGTPADKIGLSAGDVIQSIDGVGVSSTDQLRGAMNTHRLGDHVTVTWTDTSGAQHSATATPTAGPAN
jgi:S1-C subfamily serine protease